MLDQQTDRPPDSVGLSAPTKPTVLQTSYGVWNWYKHTNFVKILTVGALIGFSEPCLTNIVGQFSRAKREN